MLGASAAGAIGAVGAGFALTDHSGSTSPTGAFVTKTTENLMRAFVAGPAGHSQPVPKDNVAEVYA